MVLGGVHASTFDTVEVALEPGLPRILLNKVEIQGVLVNLFRNAGEAMRGRNCRTLSIDTRRDGPDAVLLSVSDTGAGIDPRTAARLLQPFATGKQDGMGLGLRLPGHRRTPWRPHLGGAQ